MNLLGYKVIFHRPETEEIKVYGKIFNYIPITQTLVTSWIVVCILILLLYLLTKKLEIFPKSKKQIIIEAAYNFILGLGKMILGEEAIKFLPFISTLFYYIFLCNIMEFFPCPYITFSHGVAQIEPLFRAPTGDLTTTVSLAIIALVGWTTVTIKYRGLSGYFKEFVEPVFFMLPINLLEIVAKPFSLAMRLFGNIFAGSLVMGLLYKSVPIFIPVFMHLYFDIFVGVIQSCIFVILTMVNMSFAIKHAEHAKHEKC